jgi:hypothetical protein
MALSFPGTVGLQYIAPTPQVRFDAVAEDTYPVGIAGGKWVVSLWVRPSDVSQTQELVVVADDVYPGFYAVFFVIRLEGGVGAGTVTVIMQSTLFAFCIVRRSVPGALVNDVWQHLFVQFETNAGTAHIYIDGVETAYAFERDETLLAPVGGSYIMLGSTYRGLSGGTFLAAGFRTFDGDPGNADPAKQFTTTPGDFYTGDMQAVGLWHGGVFTPTPNDFSTMLADGYSPLFFQSRLTGSTSTHGLLMYMPLIGEVATEEADPMTGGVPELTVGTGTLTWTDGPGIAEPCDTDEPGPGVPVPARPKLCLPFGMPRAEIYSNPGDGATILPVVYGDFRDGGIRGPVPAILIDQGEDNEGPWVYCAAFHPVLSLDAVYIEDVQQTTGFVVSTSNNFQNQGTIATITFDVQPEGEVSWRGQGVMNSDGTLMENCIDQLVHLLTVFGNFTQEDDFEAGALAESRSKVTTLGYLTAFVVRNEQVTQDWLTEMLFNVMGYWRINGREQVEIRVDDGSTPTQADIVAYFIASRDCVGGDEGVAFVIDRRSLVNDLAVNFAWCYSRQVASFRAVGLADAVSVEAYGEMKKEVTLIGLRRAVDVVIWSAILLLRQAARTRVEGGLVQLTVYGHCAAHVTIGDYICVSWPYGPTREGGRPYVNEICRVVDVVLDGGTRGGAITLTAADLGAYLTGPDGTRVLDPWPA